MKKSLFFILLLILLSSCGGTNDISKKYPGSYRSVDISNNDLFYGVNIKKNRTFEFWYLNNNGEIVFIEYKLKDINILNHYNFFYDTDLYPTWIYEYSDENSPIKVVFFEYRNGNVVPYIIFKSENIDYLDLEHAINIDNKSFKDPIDQFSNYSKLLNNSDGYNYPTITNIKNEQIFLKKEKRHLLFNNIDNKYFIFNGIVNSQYYKKTNLSYSSYAKVDNIEGAGQYRWDEYNIILVGDTEDKFFIKLHTSETRSDFEPSTNTYGIDSKVSVIGKVLSYSFKDDQKTIVEINVREVR